jgi:cytidyltransferase-like protein
LVVLTEKKTLGAVYSLELLERVAKTRRLARMLGLTTIEARARLDFLRRTGMIDVSGDAIQLTKRGRKSIKVVFIGGGFEVLHAGHLYTLGRAKSLGDVLVAVVARDSTIMKRKGRKPITSENQRVKLLSALRLVDAVILGGEGNIYDTLERVGPDIVALGYDQYHRVEEISREARKRGLRRLTVVRLDSPRPTLKTSRLLQEF